MEKKEAGKNLVRNRIITIVILFLASLLVDWFESYPIAVEKYYSLGVYPWICRVLHPILNLFPFSVGDLVYMVAIGLIIYFFTRLIVLAFKKRFKQAGVLILGIIISVQSAVLAFYLLWGINYFRVEPMRLPEGKYSTNLLISFTRLVIDSTNAARASVKPEDLKKDDKAISLISIKAVEALSKGFEQFPAYSPQVKSSLFTPIINYLGTSGYYNPFTTEAQVNYAMPEFLKPFVDCHEMSHQMGYGPEDEANFVGFLAGIKSNNRLLRYSAWHEILGECLIELMMRDETLEGKIKLLVSPAVHEDFIAERNFWSSYESKVDMISNIFYDNYLKANNQPQGLETYNRTIYWVMAWYSDQIPKC